MHAETKINLYFFLYNALTYKKHPNKSSSAEVKHIATLSLKIYGCRPLSKIFRDLNFLFQKFKNKRKGNLA